MSTLNNKANILLDDGVNTLEFTPKSYNIKFESLADENSGRADSGEMGINWLLNKITKLEVVLPPYYINDPIYGGILHFVQGKILTVTYFDTMELKERTTQMYCSNSSVSWNTSAIKTGIVKDAKFNLIEMDGETIIPVPTSHKVGPFDFTFSCNYDSMRYNYYGIMFTENSTNADHYKVTISYGETVLQYTYNAPDMLNVVHNISSSSLPTTATTLNVAVRAYDSNGVYEDRTITKTINYGGKLPQPTNVRRENGKLKWDYPDIPGTTFQLATNAFASSANILQLTSKEYTILSESSIVSEMDNTKTYFIHVVNPSYRGADNLSTGIYCGQLQDPTNISYNSSTRMLSWDPVPYAGAYRVAVYSQGIGTYLEFDFSHNYVEVPQGDWTSADIQAFEYSWYQPTKSRMVYYNFT